MGGSRRIRVSLFLRRHRVGETYSVERLFRGIFPHLPEDRFEVRVLVCPFQSKGLFPRLASMVWAALHQGDVNHVTGDVNFLALLLHKRRTLLTILDSASLNRLSGWRRTVYEMVWVRWPVARVSRVVAISSKTLTETLAVAPGQEAKFVVIPCCVPEGLRLDERPDPAALPRLLVVGTKPNKNLPRIVEAVAGLPCRLVIVGQLSPEQRRLIARHGVDVENHFELDDASLARQYRESDAVVFVSTYEGFGMPILEAQATGRPLITSRRDPMQEIAGKGACLVNPESVAEIRAAVLRVLYDAEYRRGLVRAGLENVKAYSPAAIARCYANEYEKLAAG